MVCDSSGRRSLSSYFLQAVVRQCVCLSLCLRNARTHLYAGTEITSPYLFERAENCFTMLRNVNPSDRPPPLVLALDEAHVMTNRDASSVPGSLLDIFCSVLADLKQFSPDGNGIIHFATIFLSTNTQLNNVAPTIGQIESQRSRTTSLAGALTCVPFDVFVEQNRKWTVEEISTLKFISSFGRPL